VRPDHEGGTADKTFHSIEKEVSLDVDEYEKEGSNGSYRSLVIVHERRSQMVVQGDLEVL
jgi:hypothetical protein